MNNDEQYVSSEDEMRRAYWLTRMLDHHAAVDAAFDRFLAHVRRDAARGAIDGLIADKAHMAALLRAENGGEAEDVLTHYRDTLHPEETP